MTPTKSLLPWARDLSERLKRAADLIGGHHDFVTPDRQEEHEAAAKSVREASVEIVNAIAQVEACGRRMDALIAERDARSNSVTTGLMTRAEFEARERAAWASIDTVKAPEAAQPNSGDRE